MKYPFFRDFFPLICIDAESANLLHVFLKKLHYHFIFFARPIEELALAQIPGLRALIQTLHTKLRCLN